jgi:hypothetical protein
MNFDIETEETMEIKRNKQGVKEVFKSQVLLRNTWAVFAY